MSRLAVFRTDGGGDLGWGHISRSLVVAGELQRRGVQSLFLLKYYDPAVISRVRDHGHEVATLKQSSNSVEEADEIAQLHHAHGGAGVITDLSHRISLEDVECHEAFLNALSGSVDRLAVFDGLYEDRVSGRIQIPSDLLIVPYCGAESLAYQASPRTRLLLGESYFVFGDAFRKRADRDRAFRENTEHLLITMGGSDPWQLTPALLDLVGTISDRRFKITCVVGSSFNAANTNRIQSLAKNIHHRVNLQFSPAILVELFMASDLAIMADGLTKYEAAITGTPGIVISSANRRNQVEGDFSEQGTAEFYYTDGKLDSAILSRLITELLTDHSRRQIMSERGRRLLDGRGVERIVNEMMEIFDFGG